FVVAGYGWVGKGIAMRAKGIGASVIICEIDPVKAIEAVMDGFRAMNMDDAAKEADFIITATGCKDVIVKHHLETMKDGAILGNAGHFANEIDLEILAELSVDKEEVRDNLFAYKLKNGKWINVLGDGNIVNISCADGHPAEFMDLSFAIQALSAKYVAENHKDLTASVIKVPNEIDNNVANLKLQSMGTKIDTLTADQKEYLSGFNV
ncbi:MAG: adenosylhomocysteinase, partial [Spirochaetales bacterium]|nr:adenosylhomocysteinase [Spirochaetales bacterium]